MTVSSVFIVRFAIQPQTDTREMSNKWEYFLEIAIIQELPFIHPTSHFS